MQRLDIWKKKKTFSILNPHNRSVMEKTRLYWILTLFQGLGAVMWGVAVLPSMAALNTPWAQSSLRSPARLFMRSKACGGRDSFCRDSIHDLSQKPNINGAQQYTIPSLPWGKFPWLVSGFYFRFRPVNLLQLFGSWLKLIKDEMTKAIASRWQIICFQATNDQRDIWCHIVRNFYQDVCKAN